MAKNRHSTQEKRTKQSRRVSFMIIVRHSAMIADQRDVM